MGLKPRGRTLVGVMMDPDLLEWIRNEAEVRRIPVSQVVRDMVLKEARASGTLMEKTV